MKTPRAFVLGAKTCALGATFCCRSRNVLGPKHVRAGRSRAVLGAFSGRSRGNENARKRLSRGEKDVWKHVEKNGKSEFRLGLRFVCWTRVFLLFERAFILFVERALICFFGRAFICCWTPFFLLNARLFCYWTRVYLFLNARLFCCWTRVYLVWTRVHFCWLNARSFCFERAFIK